MYVKKMPPRAAPRRRGLFGLGDDTDAHGCRPDQVWNDTADACVSLDDNLKIINAGVASSPSSSSSGPGLLDAFLRALLPAPTPAPVMVPSSGGISTGTVIAIAGAGLIAVMLLTRK